MDFSDFSLVGYFSCVVDKTFCLVSVDLSNRVVLTPLTHDYYVTCVCLVKGLSILGLCEYTLYDDSEFIVVWR